jgi:predicted DNA-binding transcriptional regulator
VVKENMNKDQTIGGAIFAVCAIVAMLYVLTLFYPTWLVSIGLIGSTANVSFWVIAVPVFIGFVAILGIGAWIGYTMATTKPPKPIDEDTTETQTENKPTKP